MLETTEFHTATFGGGCFWCVEAVFQRLRGVQTVVSGFAGGHTAGPSYKQVCTGTTGHAEVIRITYDPGEISYAELLEVFFATHNPTTLNRQENNIGTQYRSVIFCHDDEQKRVAEEVKASLEVSREFRDPIVTEISPAVEFHRAEDYHQNYFNLNPDQPYCARTHTMNPAGDAVKPVIPTPGRERKLASIAPARVLQV